mmetsp:Transcript_60920/g.137365  ORF Transcript_60920/g.137365 Transcript_60920/m.137365 type:complete len:219 (-) Transcript_60920:695-1351(-)
MHVNKSGFLLKRQPCPSLELFGSSGKSIGGIFTQGPPWAMPRPRSLRAPQWEPHPASFRPSARSPKACSIRCSKRSAAFAPALSFKACFCSFLAMKSSIASNGLNCGWAIPCLTAMGHTSSQPSLYSALRVTYSSTWSSSRVTQWMHSTGHDCTAALRNSSLWVHCEYTRARPCSMSIAKVRPDTSQQFLQVMQLYSSTKRNCWECHLSPRSSGFTFP